MAQSLTLTDPRYEPPKDPGFFDRIALKYINDPRDLPFIHLIVLSTIVIVPFAVALYIPGVLRWWTALLYLAILWGGFLTSFILCLHNTSHRRLFKREYKRLNYYIPWCIGPFFGETPETYFVHHIGMHHPENNLEGDASSTMPYRRDSVLGFLHYFFRFLFLGLYDLGRYHWRNRRYKLLKRMVAGELGFYLLVVALMFVNWQATLIVFVVPLVMSRLLMMAGNWGQHAFIDADDPGNPYRNSITCINCVYNKRAYNDGYHISHHVKAIRHWTEHPAELEENVETYVKEDAIIFEGIDFFIVWLFLMLGMWGKLADHFVDLRDEPRSRDEIIALLKERVQPIRRELPMTAAA